MNEQHVHACHITSDFHLIVDLNVDQIMNVFQTLHVLMKGVKTLVLEVVLQMQFVEL